MKDFKILLVEDDPINAMVVTKTFKEYSFTIASTGQSALEKVQHEHFHLILMDINLGNSDLDGITVMKKIRENSRFDKIPIFAITSYDMQEDQEKFLQEGFDNYILKPISKSNLGDLIEEVRQKMDDSED